MKAAVFLDRDDTLIRNIPYLGDPSKVELMPKVLEGLRLLQNENFSLYVVSNQSGVGRGLITIEQVQSVNVAMEKLLEGVKFSGYYLCFTEPDRVAPELDERKPSPAMLLRAAQEHRLNLEQSFMVGDRLSDLLCGRSAGCKAILILGHSGADEPSAAMKSAHYVAEDFLSAAQWIIQEKRAV